MSIPKLEDYSIESIDRAFNKLKEELFGYPAADAEQFRIDWLGRKNGKLTLVRDEWLAKAPADAKRELGRRFNEFKQEVENHIASIALLDLGETRSVADETAPALKSVLQAQKLKQKSSAERVDITLPGIRRPLGAEHPVIRTMNEMVAIFKRMGYSVGVGPEIETDYYNFESLNFPPNHPARDTQDTIFIAGQEQKPQRDRLLLRTHTSPVQTRTMEKQKPPVRIVIPGKVHRNDAADATHSPVFHQIEGLCVDTNITFSDLKGTLDHAMKAFFGSNVKTRFFPSFFPFTEPSADVAISCFKCGGTGRLGDGPCRLCKTSGWVELLGSGMVDPNVYGFVGYDPRKVSGFAFGMGVERLAMALYDIDDIQLLFQGDVRFLEQFA